MENGILFVSELRNLRKLTSMEVEMTAKSVTTVNIIDYDLLKGCWHNIIASGISSKLPNFCGQK